MKTIRSMGYAGIASLTLAFLSPSVSMADNAYERSSGSNGITVHRVSHNLAAGQQYTATESGYKWGRKAPATDSGATWTDSPATQSGFKWGSKNLGETANGVTGRDLTATESKSRWRRSDVAEQTKSRWRRSDVADQAKSRWRRSDVADQTRSRWRRS